MLNYLKTKIKSSLIITILADWIIGLTGINFEKEYSLVELIKKNSPVILDIGAHKGESIKNFLKYKPNAFIHSFEPNKKLSEILKKRFQLNKKIIIYDSAVSDKKNLKLFTPIIKGYPFTGLSSIKKENAIERLEKFYSFNFEEKNLFSAKKIKTITIDELSLKPDLIKIDIEGHEFEALKATKKTIDKYRPLIIIEFNENSFLSCEKFLRKLNYQAFLLKKWDKDSMQKIDIKDFNTIKKNKNLVNIVFIHN